MAIMDALPDACICAIVACVAETVQPAALGLPQLRRECDCVRDAIVLCAVSNAVRAAWTPHLVARLNPYSRYETLVAEHERATGKARRPTVAELKAACKAHALRVSGSWAVLAARLKAALHDPRSSHTGIGGAFCARMRALYTQTLPDDSAAVLRARLGLPPAAASRVRRPAITHAMLVREALRAHGDAHGILRAAQAMAAEAQRARLERHETLQQALAARGCALRPDSQLCAAYVAGTGALSLQQVVDATEEVQFFHRHTQYAALLGSFRRASRALDHEFGPNAYWRRREAYRDGRITSFDDPDFDSDQDDSEDEADEEARRARAKTAALRTWLKKQPLLRGVPPHALVTRLQTLDPPLPLPASLWQRAEALLRGCK